MTIRQVLQASGVSRGTVGRVLNGRGRVSGETRAHVLAVAKPSPNGLIAENQIVIRQNL